MARRSMNRRSIAGAVLLTALASLIVFAGWGRAASPLTLRTIAIDGVVGDWDAVLGNALQTTHDGDGSSSAITANCALFSTDRDCPMGGGAGNDLHTFAWTYDTSYVYLYIERYGSSANGVDFFFVADTNQDQRLKATVDRVIHARWSGSTGNVTVDAGPYSPVDALNGDLIASGAGYVDGYDLLGSNGTMSAITCAAGAIGQGVTAGADAGRKMELRDPLVRLRAPRRPALLLARGEHQQRICSTRRSTTSAPPPEGSGPSCSGPSPSPPIGAARSCRPAR